MSYKGMDTLKAAIDTIVANMDKIAEANSMDEVSSLERATAAKLHELHGHTMAASWDLKRSVDSRREELRSKEDEEISKRAGL